jgi:RHH-type proline utilization regulon transcriptional repressor/proline dehydrogenase/delta 1-pyrroline-5-carboxylate dehydrogenase
MTDLQPFKNEPVLELRRAPVRASLAEALAGLDARLPLEVPVIVGGETRTAGGPELRSHDPGAPDRVIARATVARSGDVDAAVTAAARAARAWGGLGAVERAGALIRAAAWMREQRLELTALAVRECAKPWIEADAELCEAIDYLEYYARASIELDLPRPLLQVPGEHNELCYVARGVTAVISPWNFPLAIPLGMASAALAVGNAVILKPAEQSPGCALMLVQALRAGGVPAQALSLLCGEGDVGAALVRHPGVHTIAFTGSQPVGLEIIRCAAQMAAGQNHIKRVVAELGGKNCVIVSADADLDEAVPAIVSSAFAYGGQKCSAASRVLVCDPLADALTERLGGAAGVLIVGQAEDLATQVPPLIERAAQDRLRSCGEQAQRDGRIIARVPAPESEGHFAAPTVVADLPDASPLLRDELFGPLLAVQRVRDVEHACDLIDELPVALTGGLFARDPGTVRYVRGRTPVGNLYVNRGITGAIVGRQPFGGNRLSGTGTKAGGPDYLLSFVEPRAVSENTMRHGLAI